VKCREAVTFRTTRIVKGKVIRGEAPLRCDLKADHEGEHWLALMQPWKPRTKPKRVGWVFWQADR